MKNTFGILNNFKGFGNPNGNIWFVGLEEAVDFQKNFDQILKDYSSGYIAVKEGEILEDAKKYGKNYTKVYDVMSKIMVHFFSGTDWKGYRNNKLLQSYGNEFQMNLYPLGKKDLKEWPKYYTQEFGFKSKEEYLISVQTERFPILNDWWKQYKPNFTICFGIGHIEDFKKVFFLREEGKKLNKSHSIIFPEEKVIITPFFDYRFMSQERIDEVVGAISSLNSDTLQKNFKL